MLGSSLSLVGRSPFCPQQRVRWPWLSHARLLPCPSTKTSYSCCSAFAYKRPCTPSKSASPRTGSWKFSPLQCMVMCLCALLACRSFLLHMNDSRTGLKGYEEYPLRGLGNIGTALPRQPTDSVLRLVEKDNDPYPGFQGSFRVSFRQDFGEYGVPRCSPWGWGERVLTCVVFLLCYFSCLPVLSSAGHLLLLLTCVSALPVASHWTYLIKQGKQRGLIRRCGPPEKAWTTFSCRCLSISFQAKALSLWVLLALLLAWLISIHVPFDPWTACRVGEALVPGPEVTFSTLNVASLSKQQHLLDFQASSPLVSVFTETCLTSGLLPSFQSRAKKAGNFLVSSPMVQPRTRLGKISSVIRGQTGGVVVRSSVPARASKLPWDAPGFVRPWLASSLAFMSGFLDSMECMRVLINGFWISMTPC